MIVAEMPGAYDAPRQLSAQIAAKLYIPADVSTARGRVETSVPIVVTVWASNNSSQGCNSVIQNLKLRKPCYLCKAVTYQQFLRSTV
jgi:hypothetical protein